MASKVPSVILNNGLKMPAIGLGTWAAKRGEVGTAVKKAIELGYRHIDCALVYSNEKEIGAAIREKIQDGTVRREDLYIVSKLWNTYHRPDLVVKGCQKSLKNLGLDYLDLYLIHWPMAYKPTDQADVDTKFADDWQEILKNPEFQPLDEKGNLILSDDDYIDTWKEMESCVDLGLTKSIGISNFNSKQTERILKVARIKPVTNQVELHPYLNQKKLAEFSKKDGIILTAYSPLGSPERTDVNRTLSAPIKQPIIMEIAEELGKSPGQIILRYLYELGAVSVPKSTNPKRLEENISIFDINLTPDHLKKLEALDCNERINHIPPAARDKHYPFRDDIEY